MTEGELYKRRWRVTFARLAVGAVPFLALAAVSASLVTPERRVEQFVAAALGVGLFPGVWAFVGGIWCDHRLARRGASLTLATHALGSWLTFFPAWIVASLVGDSLGGPAAEPLAGVTYAVFTPILTTVAFLAAWLVPGSFATRAQRRALDAPAATPSTVTEP